MKSSIRWNTLTPRAAVVTGLSLLMGAWLVIRFATPYSLAGTWSDIVTDALFGIVALLILGASFGWPGPERARRLMRVSALPAVTLGLFPLLIDLLMFVPPFTLGAMFHWSEVRAERVIQSVAAPDQDWTATVLFRPVGAYTGGSGRTFVKLVPRWMPFLELQLYYNRRSYADYDSTNYVQWLDSERLTIPEAEQTFRLTWWGIESEDAP